MVSRSRISPTRMMSGSCRRACLSAASKDSVSSPTSRWLTTHIRCGCTNSMGSSIVMMWPLRVRFALSMIAASVVDLPDPVGPVTSTMPRGRSAKSPRIGGILRASSGRMSQGMARRTAPIEPLLLHEVDAEPRGTGQLVGQIELLRLLEPLLLPIGEDRVDRLLELLGCQCPVAGHHLEITVDPDHGRRVDRQVQVRTALLEQVQQDLVEGDLRIGHPCRRAVQGDDAGLARLRRRDGGQPLVDGGRLGHRCAHRDRDGRRDRDPRGCARRQDRCAHGLVRWRAGGQHDVPGIRR